MLDLSQSLYIRSLNRLPVPRTPIWLMRQAGRYLPEYQATRRQAGDFLTLCKTPELACEVTLQPLRRFALDAAILFSDILTIPEALDLGLAFKEGEGPVFAKPIRDKQAIAQLPTDSALDKLHYVYQAAQLIRQEMPADLPLIGFSGSPWTLACYMIEGGSSRDFQHILRWVYEDPQSLHGLLKALAPLVEGYLIEQIKAGVNALMIFDTWGGILSSRCYLDFSCFYMGQIVQNVKKQFPATPITLFTKGGGQWLSAMAATGCDALSVDWTTSLKKARAEIGNQVALQGNLDPSILLTTPAIIYEEVQQVLMDYGPGEGHIFNLGHGITPRVPPENVAALVEAVQQLSPNYHSG